MMIRSRGGGALSTRGRTGGDPVAHVRVRVDGIAKSTAAFKQIRREANAAMRDAQQAVGERHVLPIIKARFPRKNAGVRTGLPVGAMADSLYVKRDRIDVFIGSRLRGTENRALGWVDFGGQRPGDAHERIGPTVILDTLDERQGVIRDHILAAVLDQFAKRNFDVD